MISQITTVWSQILAWIVGALGDVQLVFVSPDGSQLSFLGILAVISVGIGIVFLLIGVIQNFLHLRG